MRSALGLAALGALSLLCPPLSPPANAQATTGAIVSEFRFRGAAGPTDEYVELYNTLGSPLDISGWSIQTNSGTAAAPVFQTGTVPANTLIPALGHFLFTGSGYSLTPYGAGDASIGGDASDDSGVALFNAAGAVQDAVGFTSSHPSHPSLREGAGLASAPTVNGEYAFVREFAGTVPKDTTADSTQDFLFVLAGGTPGTPDTLATIAGTGGDLVARLGAPSPQGLSSPVNINSGITTYLFDSGAGPNVLPNRVRVGSGDSGTLLIRRTVLNQTGRTLTKMRFSVTKVTSLGSPITLTSQGDVRLITSTDETVQTSQGAKMVSGTSLEAGGAGLPTQPLGGALGSSVSFNSVLNTPLLAGETRSYSFLLQIKKSGNFAISLNNEALSVPRAIIDLTVYLGNNQATLEWSAIPTAIGYKIERKVGGGGTYAELPTRPTTPTYTDTGLTNDVTYFYRVYALNDAGSSPASNEVSVTPAVVVRGVDLSVGAGATLTGENVLYPDAQIHTVNTGAGAAAIFRIVVKNTGNTRDTFRLSGRGDTPGWKVRYFDAPTGGGEVSSLVKPNAYLTTLAGGATRELRVEVTPDASVKQNEAKDVPVAARSENEPLYNDQVTARAVQANMPQPPTVVRAVDAAIRLASETLYNGIGTTSPLAPDTAQTVSGAASDAGAAVYNWRVQNKGTAPDGFQIVLPAPQTGWSVRLFDALDGGNDITASAQNGTYAPSLAPDAFVELRLEVKPDAGTEGSLTTNLSAASVAEGTQSDVCAAVTSAMMSVSDAPLVTWSGNPRAAAGGIASALHQSTLALSATQGGVPLINTPLTLSFENNVGHNYGTVTAPNIPRRAKIYDASDAVTPWKETLTVVTDANGQVPAITLLSSDVISQPRLIARYTNAGTTETVGGVKLDFAAAISKRGVEDPALVTNPVDWPDYDTGWSCNFSALEDAGNITTGLVYMKFVDSSGTLQPVVGHSLKLGFQSVTLRDGTVVSDQDELRQYAVFIDAAGNEVASPVVTTQADGTASFRIKAKEGINFISSVSFSASNNSQWLN